MTQRPPPLDPHRRAFAQGLGHLIAELVWREFASVNTNEWGEVAPRNDDARRLAGCVADAVEVDDDIMQSSKG